MRPFAEKWDSVLINKTKRSFPLFTVKWTSIFITNEELQHERYQLVRSRYRHLAVLHIQYSYKGSVSSWMPHSLHQSPSIYCCVNEPVNMTGRLKLRSHALLTKLYIYYQNRKEGRFFKMVLLYFLYVRRGTDSSSR